MVGIKKQPQMKLFWVRCQESMIMVVNLSKNLRRTQGDRRRDRFLSYPGFTWEESKFSEPKVSKP